MANTILLKRSSVANAAPSTANLALGELAINTYDGRLYTKIDNGTPSIFELTQNQTIYLGGNLTGTSTNNGNGTSNLVATLTTTGVVAGTYGGSSGGSGNIAVVTVDQYGRITAASNASISTSGVSNGTSNISIPVANGNIEMNVGGTANVAVVTTTGVDVTGNVSATGNVISGNVNTGNLSLSGNVLSAINSTSNITTSGNVAANGFLSNNYYYANGTPLDFSQPAGANTEVQYNDGTGNFGASAAFTFDYAANVLSVTGNINSSAVNVTTVSATGNVQAANLLTSGIVSATGNITSGANVSAGNVIASSLVQGADVSATSNVSAANVNATTISATGNVIANNVSGTLTTASQPNVTSLGTLNSLTVAATILADGYSARTGADLPIQVSGANANILIQPNGTGVTDFNGKPIANISTASATGNVTAGNVLTGGLVSATGNIVTGNYFIGDGGLLTNVSAAVSVTKIVNGNSYANIASTNGNLVIVINNSTIETIANTGVYNTGLLSVAGNVTGGNFDTAGFVSAAGNVTGGNIRTGGIISSTGNITGGNILSPGYVDVSGYVQGLNLYATANVNATQGITTQGNISVQGNVLSGNLTTAGIVTSVGNVIGGNITTGGLVSATGNVSAGNLLTGGTASATGNVTGGNINTSGLVNSPTVTNLSGAITITAAANANVNIQPAGSGNIVLSNTIINSVAYPQQDQDAASKLYVDNMVSTGLAYHQEVAAATTGNLATATGGTITYAQPNGAGNGVGATLTTTGAFTLIDTANVQTVGLRILVKNEANAAHNGVYTYANTTTIVRSTDADEYGPNSSEQLSVNDYFFVDGGNVNYGTSWVVDAPTGTITFGTSNITFAEFSRSQVYTANTQAGISLAGTVINAKVDNDTTAFDLGGNISVKAGANLVTPNIGAATGTSLSTTGSITAGNLLAGSGQISTSGNITGGNVLFGSGIVSGSGQISTSGNITGGNVLFGSGQVSGTGNILTGNINATGTANVATLIVTTSANVTATTASGNSTSGALVVAGGLGVAGNVYAGALYDNGTAVLTVNSTVDGGTY